MIELRSVTARGEPERGRPAPIVRDVSFTWERGVLAILGTRADGTTTILDLVGGSVQPRAGAVLVGGTTPAAARANIVHVPSEVVLPDGLRVDEVCDLAARIRREPASPAASRLAPLGLEGLARRRVRSLSAGEARAVALSIALTSRASVLLLDEPLANLDPSAPSRVAEAIRARASDGAAIIVTTASVRDATRLADQLGVITRGVFSHLPAALAHVGHAGARLRVIISAPSKTAAAPFVAALAEESAVDAVETAAFAPSRAAGTDTEAKVGAVAVIVSGADILTLARAVSASAARSRVEVEAIESAVMPLDAIRATLASPRPGALPPAPPPAPAPPEGAA